MRQLIRAGSKKTSVTSSIPLQRYQVFSRFFLQTQQRSYQTLFAILFLYHCSIFIAKLTNRRPVIDALDS